MAQQGLPFQAISQQGFIAVVSGGIIEAPVSTASIEENSIVQTGRRCYDTGITEAAGKGIKRTQSFTV
ncbi:hypothetical protein D3C86_1492370 [compost metagenome]